MYRTTGAGKEARPPAMMAMAMLVQGYLGISDAEMIELTVVDLRVQMVLGCLGAEAAAVFARRVAGVSRTADRRRPGSPRARTHRRVGEGAPRRSTIASCPRPCAWRSIRVRWRARDASKTRSTCWPMRRAMWSAVRPACSGGPTSRCAVRRAFPCSWSRASSARSTSIGTMPVEKTDGDHDLLAATRRAAIVDRTPTARGTREAAAQGAGRDPGADPDAGSGARSPGRWVAHSRGRGGGSTGLDRGPGDASRPQEQEQAVQWIQAAHCRGRRSRPDPRLRHHAGESSRGRSDAVLDGRPGSARDSTSTTC